VGGATVAEGSAVSVGTTGKEVGAAHEVTRIMQIIENKNREVMFECMELILLDLELSLNLVSCYPPEEHTVFALGANVAPLRIPKHNQIHDIHLLTLMLNLCIL
jgi:hypothetical protein